MPNIGSFDASVNLDLRKTEAQWKRFQTQINRNFGRNNPFSTMAGGARDFDKAIGSATNRVVAFGAAAVVFNTLSRSVTAFVTAMTEVDKSLTEINVNLNQSGDGLKKFGAELFTIARQTGQTFQTAAQAATELARQGLTAEETLKRLKDALILSRRTGLSAADSVETLTAAINSFNKEALTSSEVVNKFVAVDTKFAVSSRDLAEAVSRVGSTAQAAGVGVNELIGLVTSLQQTTARGGATIGNGLKTIFTRIQAAPETVSALESVGVAIKDSAGNLRSAIDILRDYGRARERVGEAERQALDRTVAGTFQINILKAALSDLSKGYSVYDRALQTSANATDEAVRSNERLNQSLASLFNSAAVSAKQLVDAVGNAGIGPVLSGILKGVETARQYLSGDSGSKIGEALGDGILQGLTNVITGPVMLGLVALIGGTLKRVLFTFKEEAKTLFQANSAAAARAKIQERINQLYQAGTTAEQAELNVVTSITRQKEILLGIQSRLNRELLIGTELQNSFLTPRNPLRGGGFRASPQLSPGAYVGNVADPLKAAVGREIAAGVPASSIYVDKDPRAASPGNPMGVLVANRRDEPLGGFQGVNRVIASGGNPKKAGTVPNFAPPIQRGQLRTSAGGFVNQATVSAINDLLSSLSGLDRSRIKGVSTELKSLTEDLNKESRKLIQQRVLTAQSAAARREGRIISDESRLASTESLSGALSSGDVIAAQVLAARRGGTLVERGGMAAARDYNAQLTRRNPIPRVFMPASTSFPSMVGDDLIARAVDYDVNYAPGISRQAAQKRLAKMQKERAARLAREEAVALKKAQRGQRLQNAAFFGSFALPAAAGFVDAGFQGLGIKTGGGTTGGIASGALKGAGQGAALGVFGPVAGGIGAAVGALVGAFGKIKKSTEELAAEFDEAAAQRNLENDALNRAIALQEQLNDAVKNGESPQTVSKLQDQLRDVRSNIRDSRRLDILGITDQARQQEEVGKVTRESERQTAFGAIQTALSGGDFGDKFARQVAVALEDADLNLTDDTLAKIAAGDFRAPVRPLAGGDPVIAREERVKFAKDLEASNKQFAEAVDKLAPLAERAGINRSQIGRGNISQIALGLYSGIGQRTMDSEAARQRKKEDADRANSAGFVKGSFLSAPNTDIFRQAAMVGRSPYSGRTARARADFEMYGELERLGAPVIPNARTKQATAETQVGNAADAYISFLSGAGYNTSQLKNQRGDPRMDSIVRLLTQASRSGASFSGKAQDLLTSASRAQNTLTEAGVRKPVEFTQGVTGITPGADYGAFNKITKKAALRYDAAGRPILTQVPSAPAAGRSGSISSSTLDKLPAETTPPVQINVNIDGALDLISKGMDADLAVMMNTAVNKAVVDTAAQYFANIQPQLTALNAQVAAINGKPLPPAPKPTPNIMGSVNRVLGIKEPALPVVN